MWGISLDVKKDVRSQGKIIRPRHPAWTHIHGNMNWPRHSERNHLGDKWQEINEQRRHWKMIRPAPIRQSENGQIRQDCVGLPNLGGIDVNWPGWARDRRAGRQDKNNRMWTKSFTTCVADSCERFAFQFGKAACTYSAGLQACANALESWWNATEITAGSVIVWAARL